MIKLGIGFVTGRKNFKNLLKTYIHNWKESGLITTKNISLNLFIAYDLKYSATQASDYTSIDQELINMVDTIHFLDDSVIYHEQKWLIENEVISAKEGQLVFGEGYGKKRNAVVYHAVKHQMDFLLFIDDDEYPVAPVKTDSGEIIWKGQTILATHLQHILEADITHGYHCGYISPIPLLKFNRILREEDFKSFIEAVSNDIINWDSIKEKMESGGITFADQQILNSNKSFEVPEIQGTKFISGSNLCLNLNHVSKIAPFYNPPGARGEDTFLSTCLSNIKVLKVPCYAFHDGFLHYTHLLHGVLPNCLKPIQNNAREIQIRFLKAALGWIRYKPLFLYITQSEKYEAEIDNTYEKLLKSIPKLCRYFQTKEFIQVYNEFERYHILVKKHFDEFEVSKTAWRKMIQFIQSSKSMINESLMEGKKMIEENVSL